jgi:GntR family transcriptional regulator
LNGTSWEGQIMEIIIDIEDSIPIFTQLVYQIKQAVLSKQIIAGDALPSIRQLANDLDINNKTVAKAYQLLERDSVIQSKGYRGSFVHPDAIKNCDVDLSEWVTEKLNSTIKILRDSNVTDSEIRIAFSQLMNNTRI